MDPIVDLDVATSLERGIATTSRQNFLVTGGTGMLGGYVLEYLCELARLEGREVRIVAIARRVTPYLKKLSNFYPQSLCISSPEDIPIAMNQGDDWFVVHAASPASPETFDSDRIGLIDTNIQMTLRIVESLASHGGHLVYFSSGEIYGPTPDLPTRETSFSGFDHLGERGEYPEMKRAGEAIINSYSSQFGFGATCLRIYHTFGPGIDPNQSRIFSSVIRSIIDQSPIVLRSTGQAKRSFLYASDLAVATLICANQNGFRAANVAGDQEISIREFADVGSQIGGEKCPVLIMQSEPADGSNELVQSPIMRGFADTSRLKTLGWNARVTVEEAIIQTTTSVQWRQKNI
jgi:UDP-glucuronate decarboxylase